MKLAFCVVAGPLDTWTMYDPSAMCHGSCALNWVPSALTASNGIRSPTQYTAGALPKFAPVNVNVSPETAAVLIASCGGIFPCAAADVATERAHRRVTTNRTTYASSRDIITIHCSKRGVKPVCGWRVGVPTMNVRAVESECAIAVSCTGRSRVRSTFFDRTWLQGL